MKAPVVTVSLLSALALFLIIVAQFTGLVLLPSRTAAALVGSFAVASVLAFALSDYSRRPSFRCRRRDARSARPAANLDWTYTTRSA